LTIRGSFIDNQYRLRYKQTKQLEASRMSEILPIYYMAQIKEQLDYWNIDSQEWMRYNKVTEYQLNNYEETIDYSTYESLISSAIELSKIQALGLYVGERIGLTSHGMLGYAMLNSGSGREAIQIFQEFINTRTPFVTINLSENNDVLSLEFIEMREIDKVRKTFLEALFVTFHNILSQISFGDIQISSVTFGYNEPNYASKYQEFFDCPFHFSTGINKIDIPVDYLDTPLKLSNPTSLKQARHLCEIELKKLSITDRSKSLSSRIREMLITSVGNFPTLEKTSTRLNMTSRTLHRHLEKENTSYKEILEEVSFNISKEYLLQSTLTIQEISVLLGYIDVANFRRAFKRWSGITPSDYKQKNKK